MSAIIQSQEIVRLYEYDYDKPPLDDEILQHYGVKGMKWGIRKDKKKIFGKKRRKKNEKTYKSNEEAIAAKDLKYIHKNKDKFSTKELNQVMSRIEAETKLDKMVKESSHKGRNQAKKMLNNKYVKAAGVLTLAVAAAAVYNHIHAIWFAKPRRLPNPDAKSGAQIFKDFKNGLKKAAPGEIERVVPGFAIFKKLLVR